MCVYLRAKVEVSRIILTSFRQGGNFFFFLSGTEIGMRSVFQKKNKKEWVGLNEEVGFLAFGDLLEVFIALSVCFSTFFYISHR